MKLPNKINALKNAVHPTDIKFFRINQLSKTIYSWLHYTYQSVAYSYEKVIFWTGDLKSIWCSEKHFDFWFMYPIFRWKGTSHFILWRNPSTNFGSFVTINRRKRSKCYSLFIMTFIWHWKKSFPDRKRVIEYYLCLWKKQIVVVESRSIFFSSKIVLLQVDWFTGYHGIMIEHLRSGALSNIGVLLKLLFSLNCETTIAFRGIFRLHFHHLGVCHTVHHIVLPHMWVHHTMRNESLAHLGFPFPVGLPPSLLCNHSFQSY